MIKRFAQCLREYKWTALVSPVCMIGEVAMEVTIPLVMADLYDYGIAVGNMTVVWQKALQLLICAIVSLMFGVMSANYASKAATGFARNLRHDMYYRVQDFSFSNIDKFSSASIVTRLTSDVANIQMAFQMMIRMAIRCPMMLILAMVSSMRISPKLSTVYFIAIPILAAVLLGIVPLVFKIFDRVFKTYDRLNTVVQENVHGIRVVKSFVREDKEVSKFKTISKAIYDDFCKAEHILALNAPAMQICVYACILTISWVGAKMVVASGNNAALGLTTGGLSSMFTYTTQILSSLMMLSMVFVMVTQSAAAAQRIEEVLEEQPDITSPENAVKTVKDGSVDFSHVTFAYQQRSGKPVLSDIDLHIRSGETIGVMGGTGSSKSSLVSLISRLYDVTAGEVRVGGVDVRKYDVESLRDAVSVVLQNNVLFSGTIYDNLRWGNENATDEQCREACRLACADEFIERFPEKYNTRIERGGTNVSGGQKQRLCIARALLKNPKVLILDDSTSAVDTATDAKIREAMRTHIPGTTKIIIAQRISSIQDADRVLVLDNGRVNAFDTPENLLKTNAIYQEVYNSQAGSGSGDFDEAAMKGGD